MSSITRASSIADLRSPVAIVCHDAGGANLIAAWLASEPLRDFLICVDGPARRIFAQVVPERTVLSLPEALEDATCLLSGSGWGSDLEHRARMLAKRRQMPVLAVLDHWVNYRMRFNRGNVEALPDVFVVTDQYAADLATAEFGTAYSVVMWENRYLQIEVANVRKYSERIGADPPARLLVVLEPIRADWLDAASEPGEMRALDHLMVNMPAISPNPRELFVRLRPHPSESASKYIPWIRRQSNARIEISDSPSLAVDVAWCDMAAGLESYALIVALESGRRALSYLPSGAPRCSLRHPGLEHLQQLIESAR